VFKRLQDKIRASRCSSLMKGENGSYIFVHINKTAGTSILKAIGQARKKHLTAREIIGRVGLDQWEEAYKFTVVRNPWNKVVSHYKYRVKTNQTQMGVKHISFKEWVIRTYGEEKDEYYYDNAKMFQPQVAWLKDLDGVISFDRIIKFENLSAGFKEVSSALGLTDELDHLNRTSKTNFSEFFDEETAQVVAHWFQEDIDFFGYNCPISN
jgi:chondroitin 4-sulfotransferase 11